MADPIPFKKPERKIRIARPDGKDRALILQELLDCVVKAEADPGFVGFALVCLMDDGRRISHWNTIRCAVPQLAKQVRREAADIAKFISTDERMME